MSESRSDDTTPQPACPICRGPRHAWTVCPTCEATSQPPDVRHVLADMHARNMPATDAATWAQRIRTQVAERRHA